MGVSVHNKKFAFVENETITQELYY